jgi:hypothetical protein
MSGEQASQFTSPRHEMACCNNNLCSEPSSPDTNKRIMFRDGASCRLNGLPNSRRIGNWENNWQQGQNQRLSNEHYTAKWIRGCYDYAKHSRDALPMCRFRNYPFKRVRCFCSNPVQRTGTYDINEQSNKSIQFRHLNQLVPPYQ